MANNLHFRTHVQLKSIIGKELINFEKKVSNICEKLAVNLYVERVKAILKEKNMINCGRGRIKRMMKHPNQLRDLFNIEYSRAKIENIIKNKKS